MSGYDGRRRALWVGFLGVVLLLVVLRIVRPPAGATVYVAWDPAVSAELRAQLEAQFTLEAAEHNEGTTWRYQLRDTRLANVAAIVGHPQVADTHQIDRETFAVEPDDPGRLADLWWALTGGAMLALAWRVLRPAGTPDALRAMLFRGVPRISAHTLGWVRVIYAAYLAHSISRDLVYPWVSFPLADHRVAGFFADRSWVHWLAAEPGRWVSLEIATLGLAVFFLLGIGGRIAYAGLAAGVCTHVFLELLRSSQHDWGIPLITALGMLAVPWEETPSLRELIRSPRPGSHTEPTARYGFALWWPTLTIGVALLAAAIAKLHTTGLAWVSGGAIRYHFVSDAAAAPVDWGASIATNDVLTVLISAMAVALEAGFIAVTVVRSERTRLLFGGAAAAMFAGFYLFQGVSWFPWWGLLFVLLPWERLEAPRAGAQQSTALSRSMPATAQIAVALVFVLQQPVASALQVEIEPFVSDYPMYSHSYPSKDAFNERLPPQVVYRVPGAPGTGDVSGRLQILGLTELLERTVARPPDVALESADLTELSALRERYARAYGGELQTLDVVTVARRFDWQRGVFERQVLQAFRIDLESGTVAPIRYRSVGEDLVEEDLDVR